MDFGLNELLQRIRRHAGLNSEMRAWFIDNHTAYPDFPIDAVDFVSNNYLGKGCTGWIVRQYKKQLTYQKNANHDARSRS